MVMARPSPLQKGRGTRPLPHSPLDPRPSSLYPPSPCVFPTAICCPNSSPLSALLRHRFPCYLPALRAKRILCPQLRRSLRTHHEPPNSRRSSFSKSTLQLRLLQSPRIAHLARHFLQHPNRRDDPSHRYLP